MSIFIEEKQYISVKCHRGKCSDCKNQKGTCQHMCHRVQQLNEEKRISDLEILDRKVCELFQRIKEDFIV